jgi:hypothetical protein
MKIEKKYGSEEFLLNSFLKNFSIEGIEKE